jgi:hypothetical protein
MVEENLMDNIGPRLRQPTRLTQLDKTRFELEWILPLEPGLSTHVTLFDLECYPPHPLATGEGADEADALLDLWTKLTARSESDEALAIVAGAHHRRTGLQPAQTKTASSDHEA